MSDKELDRSGTALQLFRDAVDRAWRIVHPPSNSAVQYYLVELLYHFTPKQERRISGRSLLGDLWRILHTMREDQRMRRVKEIADASLAAAGLLGPYWLRKDAAIKFYMSVGECAYGALTEIAEPHHLYMPVWKVFAENLAPYVEVLENARSSFVGMRAGLEEIVRTCQAYLAKDDETSRAWFEEHGIVLLPEFTESLDKLIIP